MIQINDPLSGWVPPTHQELRHHAREAAEASLEHMAGKVAEDAAGTPSWEEYGQNVGVHAHAGQTYLGLHPDDPDHEKYFDQEYGTDTQAPNGFLRSAFNRHERAAAAVLTEQLLHRTLKGSSDG